MSGFILEDCPFCGVAPMVTVRASGNTVIQCDHDLCRVYVSAIGDTEKDAVDFWNGRV